MALVPNPAKSYFIRLRGKVLGPFAVDRLQSMFSRGQFSRHHEISLDRAKWEQAGPFLDALVAPPAPEPVAVEATPAPAEPPRTVPAANWYYSIGSEQHGPVSVIDLRTMRLNGRLHGTDLVWRDGLNDWQPVSTIPELQTESAGRPTEHSGDGIHRTSGFAVTSMILGILGILTPLLIFNLLAVIFGSIALKSIALSSAKLGGRGLALTGLILGTVGLALWGLVICWWLGLISLDGILVFFGY